MTDKKASQIKFMVLKVDNWNNLALPITNKEDEFVVRLFSSVEEAKAYINKKYTSDLEWVEYNCLYSPMAAKGRAFDAEYKVYRL